MTLQVKDAVAQERSSGEQLIEAIKNLQESEESVNSVAQKLKTETQDVMLAIQKLGNNEE